MTAINAKPVVAMTIDCIVRAEFGMSEPDRHAQECNVLVRCEAVQIGRKQLAGDLALPAGADGLVVFAHGSGSSRSSPRNRLVAAALQSRQLATLLLDLLTDDEAQDRRHVFDIALLARRLSEAIDWCRAEPRLAALRLGLFGASTGAAAALVAAAAQPQRVAAVVSRGGRPDLAGAALPNVRAPTLLIVGGDDAGVLQLNRAALAALTCDAQLQIVPGATHLFEEAGTLEAVAELAADWFARHLRRQAGALDQQEVP